MTKELEYNWNRNRATAYLVSAWAFLLTNMAIGGTVNSLQGYPNTHKDENIMLVLMMVTYCIMVCKNEMFNYVNYNFIGSMGQTIKLNVIKLDVSGMMWMLYTVFGVFLGYGLSNVIIIPHWTALIVGIGLYVANCYYEGMRFNDRLTTYLLSNLFGVGTIIILSLITLNIYSVFSYVLWFMAINFVCHEASHPIIYNWDTSFVCAVPMTIPFAVIWFLIEVKKYVQKLHVDVEALNGIA